jgi:pseudo-response regulator 7
MEQAGKVAAHLDRAEHIEKRESQRHDGLDNSGGSGDNHGNSSGNQSGANNTSGGGSNFGSNGRSSATPGSGATTETGNGTGASGTGAEAGQQNAPHAPGTTENGGNEMAVDGVEEVDKSARREAALNKFRQKRKERNFEKKVRYQSRKRLAEQRPRIRGQFVRQATFPNAVQQFVRVPGSQGEPL